VIDALLSDLDTLLLLALAGGAVLGGVLMLVLRQPMRVALALIVTMICLGGLFGLLGMHFAAAFQVLIYVGAVMVFMVFAIMLLDDRDASYANVFSRWSVPAAIVAVVLVVALGGMLVQWAPDAPAAIVGGPAPFSFPAFSLEFIRHYWFHFEVASILLVIGIVAAWAVIAERR